MHGYNTFAVGKWHLTPDEETSQAGPYERWPLGRGFDNFYGFMGRETDQYTPEIWRDNTRIDSPSKINYHLSEDLVDQSINYIRDVEAVAPNKPFFLYLAFGAGHAPHQVPKEWSDKYKGKFDGGWDKEREQILAKQKEMGIIPKDTKLPNRNPGVKAWNQLSKDEKKLYARMNEVYAGFVEHADYQIGRLVQYLEDAKLIENTIIVIAVGDNGASQEGGPTGSVNENRFFNNVAEDLATNLKNLDKLGTEYSYNHYPIGWAMVGNTGLQTKSY